MVKTSGTFEKNTTTIIIITAFLVVFLAVTVHGIATKKAKLVG